MFNYLLKKNSINLNNSQIRPKIFHKKSIIQKTNFRFLISGRLNGVRMARNYKKYFGNTKTQTLNVKTNYISRDLYTKWGVWGIKIWNVNKKI